MTDGGLLSYSFICLLYQQHQLLFYCCVCYGALYSIQDPTLVTDRRLDISAFTVLIPGIYYSKVAE